jgi:glutaminyl-peptide cyclotransferase
MTVTSISDLLVRGPIGMPEAHLQCQLMAAPRFCSALLLLSLGFAAVDPARADDSFQIIHSYPHDRGAFTQGLLYLDGHLYESTGLEGQSSLRMEDLETGRILQHIDLPAKDFGEGLAAFGSTLVQLTWQNHVIYVYDRFSFRQLRTVNYPGEGWGLTSDGKNLILSDGTATLRFLNPDTFQELRRITVKSHGDPVTRLNELEYIHGEIYANIWYSDRIVRISPRDGSVLGFIDLTGLLPAAERSSSGAVLNGIAYDAQHDRLFVTGKLWPKIFEIKVVPEKRAK